MRCIKCGKEVNDMIYEQAESRALSDKEMKQARSDFTRFCQANIKFYNVLCGKKCHEEPMNLSLPDLSRWRMA